MKHLSKVSTESVLAKAKRDSLIAHRLIDLVSTKGLRDDLRSCLGMPTDKLAEFVMADILGASVTDSHGSDFIKDGKKSEGKFAVVACRDTVSKKTRKDGSVAEYFSSSKEAYVGNLHSKDVDLHIMVCDPFDEGKYFKLFSIPKKVWKDNWKTNKVTMCLGDNAKAWYMDYMVKTWSIV